MNCEMSPRNRELLILGILLALGLLTRFFGIGYQSIWIDEGSTFYFSHYSWEAFWSTPEPNPPVYYSMEGIFLDLLGQNELALRFTSAIAGAISVPLIYILSMRLFRSRPAALVSSALLLLSPICLFYGQEARGYMIVLMIFIIQIMVLLKALDSGMNRYWLLFALISALQFTMQYTGIMATFTLYVCAAYRCLKDGFSKDRYRVPKQILWSGLLFLLLISPLMTKYLYDNTFVITESHRWSWCFVGIEYTINHLNDLLFGVPFSFILLPLAVLGAYLCFRKDRDSSVILCIIMFFPLFVLTMESLKSNVTPRYALWSAVGFYLMIPYGVHELESRGLLNKKTIAAVSAALIIIAAVVLPIYYTEVTKEDFRTGAAVLEDNVRPGDLVLYAIGTENPVYACISFYYDPAAEGIDTRGVMSNEEFWAILDSGGYGTVYILILSDYDPYEYLMHVDSDNCERICDAYRISVFRITGPLPH